MNGVVHFEMASDNLERVATHSAACGWETQTMGSQMGNYVLAREDMKEEQRMLYPGLPPVAVTS